MADKIKPDFPEKVQEAFDIIWLQKKECLEWEMEQLKTFLKLCESPLEQFLLLEFSQTFSAEPAVAPGVVKFKNQNIHGMNLVSFLVFLLLQLFY
jgi:hypothetical protein